MVKRQPNRRALDQVSELNTVLGSGSIFEGVLRGTGNCKVAGNVVGDCYLEGALLLEPDGSWVGDINADVVVIAGDVEGNISATTQLEVAGTGRIRGTLQSPVIALEDGAEHEGEMHMKQSHQFTEQRKE